MRSLVLAAAATGLAAPALAEPAAMVGAAQAVATPAGAAGGTAPEAGPAAPSGRSAAQGPGFELEVNNGKPEAGVSMAWPLRVDQRAEGPDGRTGFYGRTLLTAAAAVPIGGGDDLTSPQLLDKLSNGPSLTFSLSRYEMRRRDDDSPQDGSWQFGAEGSVGVNRFDFREPGTLTKRSADKWQFTLGGFVTFYPPDQRSMVNVGVKSQRAYKKRDSEVLCKPVVVTPADDCAQAPAAGPTRNDDVLLSLEYRRSIGIGWSFADLAVSPTVTVDALDGEVGAELPLYLLPPGKSPVLPGVKLGYTSEEDEVTLGVFLKAKFGMRR